MSTSLIIAAAIAATSGSCSWAHPGANPYRGTPAAALADFAMPDETRKRLQAMMEAQKYSDVAQISRDRILGNSEYTDLREMHSGRGDICHGAVDRSAWTEHRRERGLVYCVGETCVIVPTICNNVSLVSRKQGGSAEGEGPIDINPAAGPPQAVAAASPDVLPGGGASTPESTAPIMAGAPAELGLVAPEAPPLFGSGPIGGPGGGGCCGVVVLPVGGGGFIGPTGGPGGGGVITPVPEPSSWALFVAGLLALAGAGRLQGRRGRTD